MLRMAIEEATKCGAVIANLVISCNVAIDGPQKDHAQHARKEEHNDDGIDDAEPVDACSLGGLQVRVPTRCPLEVCASALQLHNMTVK